MSSAEILALRNNFLEMILRRVVEALAGAFFPGIGDAFMQLVAWADDLREALAGIPIVGDLIEAITGIEDGDLNDLGTFFLNLRNFFQAINFFDGSFDLEAAWEAFFEMVIRPFLNAILSSIFGGLSFDILPTVEEIWTWVGNTLLKPLDIFSIPADVLANINEALSHMQDALDGTYTGSDPTLLAVQALAEAWLTATSPLNAGNVTGTLSDGVIPVLSQSKITGLISALAGKATPGDITAAVGDIRAALEGTYSGANSILLAIKAAAAEWLTGSSALDSSNLTGAIDETLIPLLTTGKIPNLDQSKITGLVSDLAAKLTAASSLDSSKLTGSISESLIPLLTAAKIPNLDQSKINGLASTLATFLTDSSAIPQSQITGLVADLAAKLTSASNLDATKLINTINAARIPTLDQSKVSGLAAALAALTSGADFQALLNNLFDGANGSTGSTGKTLAQVLAALQGQRTAITAAASDASDASSDAGAALGNWSSLLSGMSQSTVGTLVSDLLGTKSTASTAASDAATAASDASAAQTAAGDAQTAASDAQGTADAAQSTALTTLTSLFNKLGGNNASSASKAQADAAMQALANTIGAQGAAISALQSTLGGSNGFSAVVPFKQPETTVYDTEGGFTYTLPSWFNPATDSLDAIVLGAGGGGGGGTTDSSTPGTASAFRVAGVTKASGAGGAAVSSGPGTPIGLSPGNQTYLDILYAGGGIASVRQVGQAPGGGGGGGDFFGIQGKGGNAGSWDTATLGPGTLSGALTGIVGDGGAGAFGGYGAARGADGCVWLRARAAMPGSFTSMGNFPGTSIPMYRLNTGTALTDAMTAAGTWSRIPPGGSSGGHILIIRANTAFTTYVYLWVKTVSGATNYEIGRVSSGTKSPWKTGTVGDSVPFNAFSLASDDGYVYTVSVNGNPVDSYNDSAHSSVLGASYRSGGWATSDTLAGGAGSIVQFAFLDTGIAARITSNTIATAQTTASTSYTDLASVGPSVTILVPQSGEVTVNIGALMAAGGIGQVPFASFAVSGANTIAASDSRCIRGVGSSGRTFHLKGLTPGTTTFTMKYHTTTSGSQVATFTDRDIIVEPKP